MSTIGKRLKQFRIIKNLTQLDLAELMHTSQAYIGYLENDKKTPGANLLTNLKINSDISIDWLLTGKGSMFLSAESDNDPNVVNIKLKKGQILKVEYEE